MMAVVVVVSAARQDDDDVMMHAIFFFCSSRSFLLSFTFHKHWKTTIIDSNGVRYRQFYQQIILGSVPFFRPL